MPQHFRAIGFEINSSEKLKQTALDVIDQGTAIVSGRAGVPEANFFQDFGRGLQLWVAARKQNEEYEIVSCLPGFATESIIKLRAYRIAGTKDQSEIRLRGRLEEGAEVEMVLLNLVMNDSMATSGLNLDLHVSGLGIELEILDRSGQNKKVVQIQNDEGELETVESMFVPLDKDCHYLLMGKVKSVREISNFHTGAKLVAIGLATSEIDLPLIFTRETVTKLPIEGDIIQTTIWLQGQLQNQQV